MKSIKVYQDDKGQERELAVRKKQQHDQQEQLEQRSEDSSVPWDKYKENIQPISQGRRMNCLIQGLSLIDNKEGRKKLLEERKEKFDKDLADCGDDASKQLDIWQNYLDWLEQNVPDGAKLDGVITNAIETCIELYYDKREFKQDERLFDIFMKFKRFCDEPLEIFSFMYANSICHLLARFYLNWSWQYECRKNLNRAETMLKLGLKNLASPREILQEALEQLKLRLARLIRDGALDDCGTGPRGPSSQIELRNTGIRAALQTLRCSKRTSKAPIQRTGRALVSQTRLVNGTVRRKATSIMAPSVPNVAEIGIETGILGMTKIPTRQKISALGKIGPENQVPKSGTLGTD